MHKSLASAAVRGVGAVVAPQSTGLATSSEVAAYLGVPPRTLDQWAYLGRGPRYSRVGRHRRYRWSDVEKYLDEKAVVSGGPDAAA